MKNKLTTIIKPFLKSVESQLTLEAMDDYDAEEFLTHAECCMGWGDLPMDAEENHPELIAEKFGEFTGCVIDYEDELNGYVPTRDGGIELISTELA